MSLRARVLTIAVLAGVVAVSSALAGCDLNVIAAAAHPHPFPLIGRS